MHSFWVSPAAAEVKSRVEFLKTPEVQFIINKGIKEVKPKVKQTVAGATNVTLGAAAFWGACTAGGGYAVSLIAAAWGFGQAVYGMGMFVSGAVDIWRHVEHVHTDINAIDRAKQEEKNQEAIQQAIQKEITKIKNNLKIDFDETAHHQFWRVRGKHHYLDGSREIPDHILAMMHAARQHYTSVDAFVAAIDHARQMSFVSRFFKSHFRDPITEKVYNANTRDLRTLVVDKPIMPRI